VKLSALIPKSIAGRTIAILLIGLTVSHLASIGAYHFDASALDEKTFEKNLAEAIVSARTAMLEAEPNERERVAHLLSSRAFDTHWERGDPDLDATREPEATDLRELRGRLEDARPELRGLRLQLARARDDGRLGQDDGKRLFVSIALPGEGQIHLHATQPDDDMFKIGRVLLSTGLMAMAVLALSFLLIRAALEPLRAMGRAAERLGVDVTAPPLAEKGPTEIRQAARAFNDMQRRIERLLEDRTQMLAAISHDLRTPLTVMQLRSEFIGDDGLREKFLSDIADMEAMIGSTLSYLREERSGEKSEIVDVAAILQTICDDLADAGFPVHYDGLDHAPLRCRPVALKRAFTNLIDNAVKYGERANVKLSRADGGLSATIEDEGPGIPEAEREKVFAPFYRIEGSRSRETGGFGLGMAVARTTVRAHGGDILLADRLDRGLVVTVNLPGIFE